MVWKTFTEQGFEYVCEQGGQVRKYGPTIYRYRVKDIEGGRSEEEVRAFCLAVVRKADYPKQHDLRTHFKGLRKESEGVWIYTCGHDYTG